MKFRNTLIQINFKFIEFGNFLTFLFGDTIFEEHAFIFNDFMSAFLHQIFEF